jgi:YD repeat-containing protein
LIPSRPLGSRGPTALIGEKLAAHWRERLGWFVAARRARQRWNISTINGC